MKTTTNEEPMPNAHAMPTPDLDAADRKPIEHWRDLHATPEWLFAATRVGLQWARGFELTEADYFAGLDWALTIPCR